MATKRVHTARERTDLLRFEAAVLKAWRLGCDTAEIALRLQQPEPRVARLIAADLNARYVIEGGAL